MYTYTCKGSIYHILPTSPTSKSLHVLYTYIYIYRCVWNSLNVTYTYTYIYMCVCNSPNVTHEQIRDKEQEGILICNSHIFKGSIYVMITGQI